MDNNIYTLILGMQKGDEKCLLCLLDKFSPLIKNLSFRMAEKTKADREDIYADLQLLFIVLIREIKLNKLRNTEDGVLTKYIVKSMRRMKCPSIDYNNQIVRWDDMSPSEVREVEYKLGIYDSHDGLLQNDLKKVLTPKEYKIIKEFFFEGKSIIEIAQSMSTSRQSVNQIKLLALKKLRERLCIQ